MRLFEILESNRFSSKTFFKILVPFLFLLLLTIAIPSVAQDATGTHTGTINDLTSAIAGKPTLSEIGAETGHNKIAINIVWTLIAGWFCTC